jgi:hypothetical protein
MCSSSLQLSAGKRFQESRRFISRDDRDFQLGRQGEAYLQYIHFQEFKYG